MFKYSLVILCYVASVPKQSSALNWCSSNGLATSLECLLKVEKYVNNWSERLNRRIGCSEKGDCTPRPWQVLDSKVRLVRKYYDCMKKIADLKKAKLLNGPEIKELLASELRCRMDLALNLPEDFKSYYLPLLPEINNE